MKIGNAKQFVNLLRSLSSALIEMKIYRSDSIFKGKSHKMIQCETNLKCTIRKDLMNDLYYQKALVRSVQVNLT